MAMAAGVMSRAFMGAASEDICFRYERSTAFRKSNGFCRAYGKLSILAAWTLLATGSCSARQYSQIGAPQVVRELRHFGRLYPSYVCSGG